MTTNLKKIICLVTVFAIAIMAFNFLFPFGKEVTNLEVITECEKGNDDTYANVNSICADIIEAKVGKRPEKVKVDVWSYDPMDYKAYIYYKIDNVWYKNEQQGISLVFKGLIYKPYRKLDNAIGNDVILK